LAVAKDGLTAKQRAAVKRGLTAKQLAALASLRKAQFKGLVLVKPGERVWFGEQVDERPEVQALFRAIQSSLPKLKKLFEEYSSHWNYEDPIYRFYCGSFKVYWLQESTKKIVAALRKLLPKRKLSESFTGIVKRGTGKVFTLEHNSRWDEETAPIVESFLHARYFLDMVVRYGQELTFPPTFLPSGWAAVLCLYGLR
jgi:hypothetical protein